MANGKFKETIRTFEEQATRNKFSLHVTLQCVLEMKVFITQCCYRWYICVITFTTLIKSVLKEGRKKKRKKIECGNFPGYCWF